MELPFLEYENINQKVTAGAMKLLEKSLQSSQLSPDYFSEINDKEYVANTLRLIKSNASRLYENLSITEQYEIDQFVEKAKNLSEYEYYLNNHEIVEKYRKALPLTRSSQGCSGAISAPVGKFSIGLGIFVLILGLLTGGGDGFAAGFMIFLIIGGMGYWSLRQGQKYQEAVELVNKVKQDIDLEMYDYLEKQYSNLGISKVHHLKEEAESVYINFVGEERIFASLT